MKFFKKSIGLKSVKKILDGGFLTNEKTARNMPYLLFLAFLAIFYIGNSYYAEKNIRKIEQRQKDMRELRYKYVDTKSLLLQKRRASKVASSLKEKGIKEPMVPPKKIIVK
jgi:hypothetical protein